MAKKRSPIGVLIIVAVTAFVVVIVAWAVTVNKSESTKMAEAATPVVAVDAEYIEYEMLTVYNGEEFLHFDHVVDYAEGDPGNMYPYADVIASFVTISEKGEAKYYVVTPDKIDVVDTRLHRIPLTQSLHGYSVYKRSDRDNVCAKLELDGTITLFIYHDGTVEETICGVIDYTVAYDTIYWMDQLGDTVWCRNWLEPEPENEVYCLCGAYGISPHMDEAEGALVPHSQANYSAYGRHDIYSPYGVKP